MSGKAPVFTVIVEQGFTIAHASSFANTNPANVTLSPTQPGGNIYNWNINLNINSYKTAAYVGDTDIFYIGYQRTNGNNNEVGCYSVGLAYS